MGLMFEGVMYWQNLNTLIAVKDLMNSIIKKILSGLVELILYSIGGIFLDKIFSLFTNPMNPTLGGVIGLTAIISATTLLVYFIISYYHNKKTIENQFCHLTIHHENKNSQIFVTNNLTNQAYWVSGILTPYIKQKAIPEHKHKKNEMLKYFEQQKITVNNRDFLPNELNLRYRKDKTLTWTDNVDQNLLSKFKMEPPKDLKVLYLYPWYCYLSHYFCGKGAPNSLILKLSTKEAFEPNRIIGDLIENNLIECQTFISSFNSYSASISRGFSV
jgi:hypothetical protein